MSVHKLNVASHSVRGTSESDLIASAQALVPELREARFEIDRIARPPEALAERMKDAGIYSMTVPYEYGGLQTSVDTWRQVVTEIGRGDAGMAWGLTLVTACNWMAANLYPKHVSEEIFAKPGTNVAGVFSGRAVKARRTDGGIIDEQTGRDEPVQVEAHHGVDARRLHQAALRVGNNLSRPRQLRRHLLAAKVGEQSRIGIVAHIGRNVAPLEGVGEVVGCFREGRQHIVAQDEHASG